MRSNHIISVAAVLMAGVGVKVFFFSQHADASLQAPTNASINILKMQNAAPKTLPSDTYAAP